MKVVFMGTPEFSVPILRALVENGYEVAGVFTQPDKPKNRGHKLMFSPVKQYAVEQGLTVYQPLKMKDGTALATVRELNPELIVVAAYGRILPEDILNTPKYGSINVHSSLPPQRRHGEIRRPHKNNAHILSILRCSFLPLSASVRTSR